MFELKFLRWEGLAPRVKKKKKQLLCDHNVIQVALAHIMCRVIHVLVCRKLEFNTYHLGQNDYSFDALQAYCFGINIKL